MKRILIAVASVGILVPAAWMTEANAQQMSPGPAPSQAYAPSQMAPTQPYAQRRVLRSARRAPARTVANARADAAPGGANYPYKWYAAPGPNRRGNMCVTHTDALRGYGFQAPCKK